MPRSPSPPDVVEPTPLGRAMGEVAFYREHNPGFGPYLRKLREDRGLSLRDAASSTTCTGPSRTAASTCRSSRRASAR